MNRILLMCALAAFAATTALHAQGDKLEVTESVILRVGNSATDFNVRTFGFSYNYTDGFDCWTNNECEIPAFPPPPGPNDPEGLYTAFLHQPESRALMQTDIRGVPDSVGVDGVHRFALVYRFEYRYARDTVHIGFPDGLKMGIDSINVRDVIAGGAVYNHTFGRTGGMAAVPNSAINDVIMTVYYNITPQVSRIELAASARRSAGIHPNPAAAGAVIELQAEMPVDATLVVNDLLGRSVAPARPLRRGERPTLAAPGTPGVYLISIVAADGTSLYRDRLVVAR